MFGLTVIGQSPLWTDRDPVRSRLPCRHLTGLRSPANRTDLGAARRGGAAAGLEAGCRWPLVRVGGPGNGSGGVVVLIKRWRVLAIGMVFLGLLSILTIRLWYVQIAAAEVNEERALANRLREVETEAPRGRILDAGGQIIAETRASRTLLVDRRVLTLEQEEALVQNLSVLLNQPQDSLRANFDQALSGSRFVVAIDVPGRRRHTGS